ncbi:hypothetical protein Zmor_000033 [Zophobas morio]|uniref:Uncharacterized protein n=1 Tax=Zophobas morio TaxID=2755281 RepID=A0AA38IWS6_9CUCU|nr:hypothetical protein Zmor_000033 [Zophobas morio]
MARPRRILIAATRPPRILGKARVRAAPKCRACGAAGADHLEHHDEQEGQVSPTRHEPAHICHPVVFRGPLFDIRVPEPPLFMPVIDMFNSSLAGHCCAFITHFALRLLGES